MKKSGDGGPVGVMGDEATVLFAAGGMIGRGAEAIFPSEPNFFEIFVFK
jgi:hypothetical protein